MGQLVWVMQMIGNLNKYNSEFKEIICKNIKKYRKELNIKLMDLAELLDVSPEYLKRLESHSDTRKTCSLKMLYKLSIIFNKKLDDFFKED